MKLNMFKKIMALFIISALAFSVLTLTGCSTPNDRPNYVELKVRGFEGRIVIELYPDIAPKTVENFKNLVDSGFYNGLTFHRIITNFMIQGGMPNQSSPKVNPIVGEFNSNGYRNNLSHTRGVISMARTDAPNSATSQFFICNADYPSLDGNYAAFGMVVEGMDVVDAIATCKVWGAGSDFPLPAEDIVIESVTFVEPK